MSLSLRYQNETSVVFDFVKIEEFDARRDAIKLFRTKLSNLSLLCLHDENFLGI